MRHIRFAILGTVVFAASGPSLACSNGPTGAPDASPTTDAGSADGDATDDGGTLDGGPIDVGFDKPTAVLKANSGGTEIGDVDLTCLGTPSGDLPTTTSVGLTTKVVDLQTQSAIGAGVSGFAAIGYATPFDTETAAADGSVTINAPVGTKRFGIEMTSASSLDTLLVNLILDPNTATQSSPATIQSVSKSTAALFPSLVGVTRTAGTGIVLGTLRDCSKHEISNFVATVSSTEGTATPLSGADSYYFTTTTAPATHAAAESSTATGAFIILQLPPTATAHVQMWGFANATDLTAGTLTLVGELQVPVLADTVVMSDFEPRRAP